MEKANRNKRFIKVMSLPQMIVASYSVTSNIDYISNCQQTMLDFIEKYSLHEMPNFRLFGFGYESDPLDTEFTYEMWVTIPEDLVVPLPFIKKVFPGGNYVSIPSYRLDLGENYQILYDYVSDCNDYELDLQQKNMRHELEEYIDFQSFFSKNLPEEKKQLDLFIPMKQIFKSESAKEEYFDSVQSAKEPQIVTLPEITIVGKEFKQKKDVYVYKVEIPWYKFGQSIKKTGKDWPSRIIKGSTTYVIKSCAKTAEKPFYLQGAKSIIDSVFGGVQIKQSLESYPDNLEERIIQEGKYLVFAISVNPKLANSVGLPTEILYDAAKRYVNETNLKINPDLCLEMEYRSNGKWIDKVELYIPFIVMC